MMKHQYQGNGYTRDEFEMVVDEVLLHLVKNIVCAELRIVAYTARGLLAAFEVISIIFRQKKIS